VVQREDCLYVCRLKMVRTFWQRCAGRQTGIEVRARVQPPQDPRVTLVDAVVRVEPFGVTGNQAVALAEEVGPALLDSLRSFLQPVPLQRAHPRHPYTMPITVYPVLPGLELGAEIAGETRDLSLGGIGLRVQELPPSEQLYLRLRVGEAVERYAVLARVVRKHPTQDGAFDLGAIFDQAASPGVQDPQA
jgi:hypothetical protein